MPIQRCQVLIDVKDPSGDPMAGAMVTARLSGDIIADIIVSSDISERVITDSDGKASLMLVPNTLGAKPTTYAISILPAGGLRARTYAGLVVPLAQSITLAQMIGGSDDAPLIAWSDDDEWDDNSVWSEG